MVGMIITQNGVSKVSGNPGADARKRAAVARKFQTTPRDNTTPIDIYAGNNAVAPPPTPKPTTNQMLPAVQPGVRALNTGGAPASNGMGSDGRQLSTGGTAGATPTPTPTPATQAPRGQPYTGLTASNGDYDDMTKLSDSQLMDIVGSGANAETEQERQEIRIRAQAEQTARSGTYTPPTGNGMGADGRQVGMVQTAPPTSAAPGSPMTPNPNAGAGGGGAGGGNAGGGQTGGGSTTTTNSSVQRAGGMLQDASVQNQLDNILAEDSALMQRARSRGMQAANSRGLLNSTMGAQAGEAAMLDIALPIASQDAGQIHEMNLQMRELFTQEQLQTAELAARKDMLGMELNSREKLAMNEIDTAMARLSMELASREKIANLDIDARERLTNMDIQLRERLTNAELSAREREAASQSAINIESTYAQMIATVMNNEAIPQATRQEYFNHAAKVRDSNYALIEQMYGIKLEWETPTAANPAVPNFGSLNI